MSAIEPLTWHTLVSAWTMPSLAAVLLPAGAAWYAWGAMRVERWPKQRTAAFVAGLAVIALAVGSSVNTYSGVLFSMHMAQHLLLIMVAPTLIIFGRPLDLAGRATTGRVRHVVTRTVRGRGLAMASHPVVAFLCYAAVVAGTHLTSFQQDALTSPWVHAGEEALYFISGYLLLLPVIGHEPIRRPLPHFIRLTLLLISMVVDTVVGLTLLMTTFEPFPAYAATGRTWGPGLIEDLHWGGAAMWIGGDVLMLALVAIVIGRWVNSPGGGADLGPWLESARRCALAGTGDQASTYLASREDIDEDDEALRAYNAMLARLAADDARQRRSP